MCSRRLASALARAHACAHGGSWRNSLVFHSLDRVTSSYIHILPPLLAFCLRWYPPEGLVFPAALPFRYAMSAALAFYLSWQAAYLFYTEVIHPPAPACDTSIRVLTSSKKGKAPPHCYTGITRTTYVSARALGIMAKGERFDAETWKTKMIFVTVQLLYTFATLLLAYGLSNSYKCHVAYLLSILACCTWNGGSYYIEVFSKAYRKQFDGDAETRRRLQVELMINGNLPDEPAPKHDPSAIESIGGSEGDATLEPPLIADRGSEGGAADKLKGE